jgi:hypothetical protein
MHVGLAITYIFIRIVVGGVYLPWTTPSNWVSNHFMASCLVTLWRVPTREEACLRRETRLPGRSNTTKKSIPKIPMWGSYFKPKEKIFGKNQGNSRKIERKKNKYMKIYTEAKNRVKRNT